MIVLFIIFALFNGVPVFKKMILKVLCLFAKKTVKYKTREAGKMNKKSALIPNTKKWEHDVA